MNLKQGKTPLWRKTILQNLNLDDLKESLSEIYESGDYYGYDGESMGEYYEEYRELFNELSLGAYDLLEAMNRVEEWEGDFCAGWDDCTVALLGETQNVLGFDTVETDYYCMLQEEQELGVRAAEKRLERLTKAHLISLFRRVMVMLVSYLDIKSAYDTLNAVVCELDSRAAAMKNGGQSAQMWSI